MIERKYKIENNRLVRRTSGVPVPEDEPLFVLRAQDRNALPAMLAYLTICTDLNHRTNVLKSIKDFKDFIDKYPNRIKEPDS